MLLNSREDEIVGDILRDIAVAAADRAMFNIQWEEVSNFVLPSFRNTFFEGSENFPGMKNTDLQIDSTAALALSRFTAIVDSLSTPRNSMWHGLEANNPDLQKVRNVKLWFEDTTRRLFRLRYAPSANFSSQNQNQWQSLGAFGNGPMFVDRFDGGRGFRYRALPLGEIYLKENHQGIIDTFYRRFQLTARQANAQFNGNLPQIILDKLKSAPETKYWFIHCVKPRADYEPGRLDYKGKKFASYHIARDQKMLVREGGYNSFPLPVSRYEQAPGETYARGPAMLVLPAIKTLNMEKRIVLKQGHRTVDPVLLSHDDGIANFSLKPGAMNVGGVNKDGRPLVVPLPVGAISVGEKMMDMEKMIINDAFLVNLFQVLLNDPKVMTATQITEMANQKGILLAPTIGRQTDYLGGLIDRELDLASDMGLLLPMPQELIEAQGEYQVVYTSPLARLAKAEENSGFMRSVETAMEIFQATQDPDVMDPFDFDTAIPEMSENNATPMRWMRSVEDITQRRKDRASQIQQQQNIQAGPAAAALIKAQAQAGQGR